MNLLKSLSLLLLSDKIFQTAYANEVCEAEGTKRYVIHKQVSNNVPHLHQHNAKYMPIATDPKNHFVYADLTAEEAANVEDHLLAGESMAVNTEFTAIPNRSLKSAAPQPDPNADASIYLTNKPAQCKNWNTVGQGKKIKLVDMDARISPNKKNKNGQLIFKGLNIVQGPRFAPDDKLPCVDHGNEVLAIMCGKNGYGIIPNCNTLVDEIVAVEVFGCKNGKTDLQNITASWAWATEYTKANIDNYNVIIHESIDSLPITGYEPVKPAVQAAVTAGAIVFFSAGNHGGDHCNNSPNLEVPGTFITGGSVSGNWVGFESNWGACVAAYFPWTVNNYNQEAIDGTSFGNPVSGARGIAIYARYPHLTHSQLFFQIVSNMDTIDPEKWHNYGIPTKITQKTKYCDMPTISMEPAPRLALH